MFDREKKIERLGEIATEVERIAKDPTVSVHKKSAFLDRAETEVREIQDEVATYDRAKAWPGAGPADLAAAMSATMTVGKKWNPPSPLHASAEQWETLYQAATSRLGGYTCRIGYDSKSLELGDVHFKAPTAEGTPGSLLPSVLTAPDFGLLYEPDRLFEKFPGRMADSQAVSYLQHTGNTNPAAAVAELGTKPDLGMQVAQKTVSFTKIAALASFSREILDDHTSFMQFVPAEMQKAIVDAETDQIVNGDGTGASMTGILHVSGVLTRAKSTDSYLDAVVKGINDLRVGSAYATADLIAMHPSTWTLLRTQKGSQGRYLLQTNADDVGGVTGIFNVPVLINSKIPAGTAIVFDTTKAVQAWTRLGLEIMTNQFGSTEWSTNAISFRAEQRIAIGVVRPTAICTVTGLT
jgi:hypothetical protein